MNKYKFLIIGLGNPGIIYEKTRHNFGFLLLNKISKKYFTPFYKKKLGDICKITYKKNLIFLLKPTTYINCSGISVKYWINKEKIFLKNILVISDDLNLKFGILRLKSKGSSGGHNGLKSIEKEIKTSNYPRLRFGIKNNLFMKKNKNYNDYVLNNWDKKEIKYLSIFFEKSVKIILSFIEYGINKTMNNFN